MGTRLNPVITYTCGVDARVLLRLTTLRRMNCGDGTLLKLHHNTRVSRGDTPLLQLVVPYRAGMKAALKTEVTVDVQIGDTLEITFDCQHTCDCDNTIYSVEIWDTSVR